MSDSARERSDRWLKALDEELARRGAMTTPTEPPAADGLRENKQPLRERLEYLATEMEDTDGWCFSAETVREAIAALSPSTGEARLREADKNLVRAWEALPSEHYVGRAGIAKVEAWLAGPMAAVVAEARARLAALASPTTDKGEG